MARYRSLRLQPKPLKGIIQLVRNNPGNMFIGEHAYLCVAGINSVSAYKTASHISRFFTKTAKNFT